MSNPLGDGVNSKAPLNFHWYKSTANEWLPFETFNLDSVTSQGVYIIWHAGHPGRVVYVGQGYVQARLGVHRANSEICRYRANGILYVTWVDVPAHQRGGVERYLADLWRPLVGDAHPDVAPIAVNSPW